MKQDAENPTEWWRIWVNYVHNRVISVRHEGSIVPGLGGASVPDYMSDVNDRLLAAEVSLPQGYQYNGLTAAAGASSAFLKSDLSIKYKATCTLQSGITLEHDTGFSMDYQEMPAKNHRGVKIEIFRDKQNHCFSTL